MTLILQINNRFFPPLLFPPAVVPLVLKGLAVIKLNLNAVLRRPKVPAVYIRQKKLSRLHKSHSYLKNQTVPFPVFQDLQVNRP